jgi:hypothetical protein
VRILKRPGARLAAFIALCLLMTIS